MLWFLLGARGMSRIWSAVWAGVITVSMALALWRRWNSALPGLLQVRLTETGCAQLVSTWAEMDVEETPWASICKVELRDRRGGRARLRFELRTPRWHLGRKYPIDADVECTPEQAEALRRRIAKWRGGL